MANDFADCTKSVDAIVCHVTTVKAELPVDSMEDRHWTIRWLVTTLLLALSGILLGLTYILDKTSNQDLLMKKIEQIAKVEVRYPLYKGAHHDIYLTADHPPTSINEIVMGDGKRGSSTGHLAALKKNQSFYSQVLRQNNSSQRSYSTDVPKHISPFLQTLEQHELLSLRHLLSVFLEACAMKNISYFLHGSSLMGSYRHHGLIPWDADMNFWVDAKDKRRLRDALSGLSSKYGHAVEKSRMIFYLDNSTKVRNKSWKFPYIDISFYKLKGNRIIDTDKRAAAKFSFPQDWMLPALHRPFEQHMVRVPRLSKAVIEKNYKLDICQTNTFDHKFRKSNRNFVSVDCKFLYDYVPFVFREYFSNFTLEKLKIGSLLLQSTKL